MSKVTGLDTSLDVYDQWIKYMPPNSHTNRQGRNNKSISVLENIDLSKEPIKGEGLFDSPCVTERVQLNGLLESTMLKRLSDNTILRKEVPENDLINPVTLPHIEVNNIANEGENHNQYDYQSMNVHRSFQKLNSKIRDQLINKSQSSSLHTPSQRGIQREVSFGHPTMIEGVKNFDLDLVNRRVENSQSYISTVSPSHMYEAGVFHTRVEQQDDEQCNENISLQDDSAFGELQSTSIKHHWNGRKCSEKPSIAKINSLCSSRETQLTHSSRGQNVLLNSGRVNAFSRNSASEEREFLFNNLKW